MKWRSKSLKAMPTDVVTQVWMMVFSCLVNGCPTRPTISATTSHNLPKKKPIRPTDICREGTNPVLKLNFIEMKVKSQLRKNPITNALKVSCSRHQGTSTSLNLISTPGVGMHSVGHGVKNCEEGSGVKKLSVFLNILRVYFLDFGPMRLSWRFWILDNHYPAVYKVYIEPKAKNRLFKISFSGQLYAIFYPFYEEDTKTPNI